MHFTQFTQMRAQQEAQANGINVREGTLEQIRAAVVELAECWHSEYPQYANHWDGPEWRLVRAARTVTGKGGCVMRSGDITIARHESRYERANRPNPWPAYVYVQSLLTQTETSVRADDVSFLTV